MGANGIAPVEDLTIGALTATIGAGNTLEEMHLKPFFMRVRGGENAAVLREVIKLGIGEHFDKIFSIHFSSIF